MKWYAEVSTSSWYLRRFASVRVADVLPVVIAAAAIYDAAVGQDDGYIHYPEELIQPVDEKIGRALLGLQANKAAHILLN